MDTLLPSTVFDLPLHPLVVHGTVVVVPLTALVVLLAAVHRRFRRWAGWLPLALAVSALVLTRVATVSGANLRRQKLDGGVTFDPVIVTHQALGEQLIWWVLGLLVVALAAYALRRREGTDRPSAVPRWVAAVVAVAGVLVAAGTVLQTVRVGHSGAQSVWNYVSEL